LIHFVPKGIIPAIGHPQLMRKAHQRKRHPETDQPLIDGGVHGLFPVGSQGEFSPSPSNRKKRHPDRRRRDPGPGPVYAGTGAVTTREAIETTKMAQGGGQRGSPFITPYFSFPARRS